MTSPGSARVPGVRSASIRVALAATIVVAALYLAIAVAVVTLVTRDLTAQIDQHLDDTLGHLLGEQLGRPDRGGGFDVPPGGGPFGPIMIVWTVHPDGTISSTDPNATLPTEYRSVARPETISIGSASVRVIGAALGDQYVVIGQSTDTISQAQSTLILSEILIAPALLLLVFLGAVTIGRRVAAPIEHARQRQLEFTADASHELRTPLSVIEAQTSLALAQDRQVEWYRTAFRRVDGESKRIRRIVEDMLWLARFDATRSRPPAEPVDLGLLAAQTADRFHAVAEARHLRLDVGAAQEGTIVTVPPEWLDRLLGVLLDNACKYSPDGGSVRVSVGGDGNRVRLSVDDSGSGIPEAERGRIFDRFHRATDAPGGAGLGLAIADAIVRATNGRWRIGTSSAGGASMSVSWQRSFGGSHEADAAPDSAATPTSAPASDSVPPTATTGSPA